MSTDKHHRRLNRQLDRLQRRAPRASRVLAWLRRPEVRLVRLPMAVLLIIGGILSFLPVLGLWMLPLGLLLAAVDVPFVRGPVTRAMGRIEAWLRRRQQRQQRKRG
jgi:hypothetical protein